MSDHTNSGTPGAQPQAYHWNPASDHPYTHPPQHATKQDRVQCVLLNRLTHALVIDPEPHQAIFKNVQNEPNGSKTIWTNDVAPHAAIILNAQLPPSDPPLEYFKMFIVVSKQHPQPDFGSTFVVKVSGMCMDKAGNPIKFDSGADEVFLEVGWQGKIGEEEKWDSLGLQEVMKAIEGNWTGLRQKIWC